ncbi:GPW/gp25 family protein [Larkinella soli]|uniref:GPW/gp25 family protein n=1 Tax=Larkinella soli TaxID=1770527 RepID=UPI000FFC0C47|nr:GPW/gp25 family protein [Larkinella soli]
MEKGYYTLPMDFESILERRQHPQCSLKESIHQHLYLLLVTHFGEARYDPSYGCELWESDFSLMSQLKWKDVIRESFEQSIARYEPRLTQVKVRVEVEEFDLMTKTNRFVRKRVGLGVEAFITRTNESFSFFERIFISPLSTD